VPRLIEGLASVRVSAVSCVWDHSLVVSDGGHIYSWGLGMCGQLGHGDEEENVSSPKLVEALQAEKIIAIAAGAHHCCAVAADGRLFGWGVAKTTEGEKVDTLGMSLEQNQCVPMQYTGLRASRPLLRRREGR